MANLTHTLLYNENENENENEQQQPSFTTVFAPSSRALQNLGLDVLEQLKRPQNRPLLTDLLKYHMTSGIVIASLDILDDDGPLQDKTVTMWNGDPATVASSGTSNITHKYVQWRIQNANVLVLNVLCTNGVLKIIDRVMVPPSLDDPNRILPRVIQSADLGLSYANNPGATSIISSAATTTTAMNIQQSLTLFVFVVAFVVVFLLL